MISFEIRIAASASKPPNAASSNLLQDRMSLGVLVRGLGLGSSKE